MLPEPVQEFLNTCDYATKRETLKVLARLSIQSGFEKAAEAVQTALEHGAFDVESIKAIFSRLNNEILNLDPPVLPTSVPKMPPAKVDVGCYDRLFLKGGSGYEN